MGQESRRLLLLVEDDEFGRMVLSELLADAGLQVIAAEDGGAAIAAFGAAQPRPAVAVIDLHLGDASGSVIGTELRRHDPRLALIYVSGLSRDAPAVVEALGDGAATRFLAKPFGLQQLLDEIHALVG